MIERGKSSPSIDMAEDTLSAAAGRGNLVMIKILVEGLWDRSQHDNPQYHNWRETASNA